MELTWNLFFWIAIVAVVAIICAALIKVVTLNADVRKYTADAANGGHYKELVERSEASNAQLLERLGTMEMRLGAIEKTLTDIP